MLFSFLLSFNASLSSALHLVSSALLLQNTSLLLRVISPNGPPTIPVPAAHSTVHYVCSLLLAADAILRLALVLSSLPLFHYGLHCGVPTILYIQRLSL